MAWFFKKWIDVAVDLDGTLVYTSGTIDLQSSMGSYRLAHGAIEFLAVLDSMPAVRTSLYSAGSPVRSTMLLDRIIVEAQKCGITFKKKLKIFNVAEGWCGTKTLKGLRRGLHVGRAILVDDQGRFSDGSEQRNLLKVYRSDAKACEDKVYIARLRNNLVRALGMIMRCTREADRYKCSVVDALFRLQWEGKTYLHESTNSNDVYEEGLHAMKLVNPNIKLDTDGSAGVDPWSRPGNHRLFHSNIFAHPFDIQAPFDSFDSSVEVVM